jgi:alpha-beta hydrolase superfamily lysophospholipase
VLVLGFSAGAIGAPTVAARLGEQVKGVVLVGGGVDISRIAQTSALSDFGLGVTFNGQRVSGDKLDRLSSAYLKAATLDSFHTCSALRHTPALMLQALADDIVPVRTGQTLYERMGKPERWIFDGGHEMLFLQLGWFDTKIADWVDGHVATHTAVPARTVTAR